VFYANKGNSVYFSHYEKELLEERKKTEFTGKISEYPSSTVQGEFPHWHNWQTSQDFTTGLNI